MLLGGLRYAIEQDFDVINMSLGSDYGPHDGSTLEERGIDARLLDLRPVRVGHEAALAGLDGTLGYHERSPALLAALQAVVHGVADQVHQGLVDGLHHASGGAQRGRRITLGAKYRRIRIIQPPPYGSVFTSSGSPAPTIPTTARRTSTNFWQ